VIETDATRLHFETMIRIVSVATTAAIANSELLKIVGNAAWAAACSRSDHHSNVGPASRKTMNELPGLRGPYSFASVSRARVLGALGFSAARPAQPLPYNPWMAWTTRREPI
jgi:hypothetical protein